MKRSLKAYFNFPLSNKDLRNIANLTIKPPFKTVKSKNVYDLFGENFIPGTFHPSERKLSPSFLFDEIDYSYEMWIRNLTRSHLKAIQEYKKIELLKDNVLLRNIQDSILKILDVIPDGFDVPLCQYITNQQITDLTFRILKTILWGNPYASCHTFKEFNEKGKQISLKILNRIRSDNPITAIKTALVCGSLGVNIKAKYHAAGPSPVISNEVISLENQYSKINIEQIINKIAQRIAKNNLIEFYNDFSENVLNTRTPILLSFFTDDYIETIFDLWAMQCLIASNPNVTIKVVPKWGHHANDASFEDLYLILNEPVFNILKRNLDNRFFIQKLGPVGSGINPFELSEPVFNILLHSDIIIFKGARSFEMLQGIKKNVYFAFNVLRSYTESLTGINAEEGQAVFINQEGIPSYDDFRYRGTRKIKLKSGRFIGLAKMTSIEYTKAIKSKNYLTLIYKYSLPKIDANIRILQLAKQNCMTFSQYITKS